MLQLEEIEAKQVERMHCTCRGHHKPCTSKPFDVQVVLEPLLVSRKLYSSYCCHPYSGPLAQATFKRTDPYRWISEFSIFQIWSQTVHIVLLHALACPNVHPKILIHHWIQTDVLFALSHCATRSCSKLHILVFARLAQRLHRFWVEGIFCQALQPPES